MGSVVLLDAAGRRRSVATLPGHHCVRAPRNRACAIRPTRRRSRRSSRVMRHAGDRAHGVRLRGLIVVLWRAGLRISEALVLTESDLDEARGAILVRHGKGNKRRVVGMDQWGWELLRPWLGYRVQIPVGPLFCVIDGAAHGLDDVVIRGKASASVVPRSFGAWPRSSGRCAELCTARDGSRCAKPVRTRPGRALVGRESSRSLAKTPIPFLSVRSLRSGERRDCEISVEGLPHHLRAGRRRRVGRPQPRRRRCLRARTDARRGRAADGRSADGTSLASASVRPANPRSTHRRRTNRRLDGMGWCLRRRCSR